MPATARPARVRPARLSRRCVQCGCHITPNDATTAEVERWFGGIPNYRHGAFACDWCDNPARANDWD